MDIDPPEPPSPAPKKVSTSTKKVSPLKFTPKPPPRRKTTPVLPRRDGSDGDDDEAAEKKQELLRKVNDRLGTRAPPVETKSSGNAATSHEPGSSRTHDLKKDGSNKSTSNLSEKRVKSSSSTTTKDENIDNMAEDHESGFSSNSENEYKEPWDSHSNYPVSLPLRPLGFGDPEILNAEEFGEEKEYDETEINSALDLGLLEYNEKKQLIFFEFPEKLPLDQQTTSKGKEKAESSGPLQKNAGLNDLPDGYMGKMLVYKSGAIKLKLGDIIFDVSPGTPSGCDQSAAMMDTKTKNCCVLGPVNKTAVVTPDLDSIMDNININQ